MAVLADDDVVVDRDAERLGDVDDLLGHLDIGEFQPFSPNCRAPQ
jgi:hypothetical protein